MKRAHVEVAIATDPESIWKLISNHRGYADLPSFDSALLIREGSPEPDGVGAIRRLNSGRWFFEEEITGFDPPRQMDYRILRSRIPIRHQGGSIEIRPTAGGVLVVWVSTFELAIPLIGRFFDARFAVGIEGAFRSLLEQWKQMLEEGVSS